jgi:hypothetical protein
MTEHLDWAFSASSGFIAANDLRDGPVCILSIVNDHATERPA